MGEPGNWLAVTKIWENYLKEKDILREGPISLPKISH